MGRPNKVLWGLEKNRKVNKRGEGGRLFGI